MISFVLQSRVQQIIGLLSWTHWVRSSHKPAAERPEHEPLCKF